MWFTSKASVKYGYATPLGAYRVFFNQALLPQHPLDGAVGRQRAAGFGHLPFDGRRAGLSILLTLQLKPGFNDAFAIAGADGFRPTDRRSGLIRIPVGITALIAFEPFEKPVLGATKLVVDALGLFSFQITLNGLFAKILFHRNTPQ